MRWTLKTVDEAQSELLATKLLDLPALRLKNPKLASTLARLLTMRGIGDAETAERFLSPSLEHLHSPYSMLGMKAAVERLDAAIEFDRAGPRAPRQIEDLERAAFEHCVA